MSDTVTKEWALKAVLHGACKIPTVGQEVLSLSFSDVSWAHTHGIANDDKTGIPAWCRSGDGDGSGYGYWDGDGSGYWDGAGSGDGSGYGYGYGDGSGDGYGYGYGDGSGSGYGYGLINKAFNQLLKGKIT